MPDDEKRRLETRWIATLILLGGAIAATIIGLVPLLFDDQERARYAVTTILTGFVAIGLAVAVVDRLRGAIAERPPGWEESQPKADSEEWDIPHLRLSGVDLRGAALAKVDLQTTELVGALFEGADLSGAALGHAQLAEADLRKADLRDANLANADLRGANLWGASVEGAQMEGALYDEDTTWPAGVERPEDLGAIDKKRSQ
jgi:hypothetical protein